MRVLFLEHLFPLPMDSGGKIKSYPTLKALAANHEVMLLSYVRSEQERALAREFETACEAVELVPMSRGAASNALTAACALVTGTSFVIRRDFRATMLCAFRKAFEEFRPEVVHIDHLQMAQFVDFDASCAFVLDNHNVESSIVRRMAETSASLAARTYARLEWPKLQRYELEVCRKCDLVLTVSEADKVVLRKLDPHLDNIHALPIGIDTDYFHVVDRSADSKNIIFLGTMYWPPNVECVDYFHRRILPLVRRAVPDCTFTIAGQRPADSVLALASDPHIAVTGYVDDVRELMRDCGAFVVPLLAGSGVRVKILNAMAMGLPIVSTSVGAEGIEAVHGEHILIADSPGEFAEAVVAVLTDRDLAARLGRAARELVCEKHSWQTTGKQLLDLYDTYVAPKVGAASAT